MKTFTLLMALLKKKEGRDAFPVGYGRQRKTPSMARSWPCAWLRILAVLCMVLHVLNAVEYEAKPALFDVGAAHHSIFSLELSDDDLRMLVRAMDEQVMLLKEKLANPNGVQRSRRDAASSPEGAELKKESIEFSIGNGTQLPPMAQFIWNDKRFLVAGSRIFSLADGKMEPFLSGLPTENGNIVRPFIYEDTIFIAIISKESSALHLYLLKSPGWIDMWFIQQIVGQQIEDCEFFEYDGTLYMALAIQSETNSSRASETMELVIFRWTGTSMDAVDSVSVEGLRDIAIIDSDTIHFVLLHKNSSIQLWRFDDDRDIQLIDQNDVQVPRVLQLETFHQNGEWYMLLGGHERSHVIQQQGERLLLRQILQHSTTTSETSWIRVHEESDDEMKDSVTLLFQPVNDEKWRQFEIFASDSLGFFANLFTTSAVSFLGIPKFSMALARDVRTIVIYTVSGSARNEYFVEAFTLKFNSGLRRPSNTDPLLECLTDVERLVEQLQSANADQATELKKNLVHYKEDVNSDMAVTVNQMSSTHYSYGNVKVMYNFTGSYQPPNKLEAGIQNLKSSFAAISNRSDNLLTDETSSFNGRLTVSGPVTVDNVVASSLKIDSVNDQTWDHFVKEAWRYSLPEVSLTNVKTEAVYAENVTVETTIGGSSPSTWLLKTGGRVHGKLKVMNLTVDGNVNVGDNLVNGVNLGEVVDATSPTSTIADAKSFRSINVENFVNVSTIKDRDFVSWASSALTQRNEQLQRITGTVTVKGSANVSDVVRANRINEVDVKKFSQTVVNKNFNNAIKGTVIFTKPLSIRDAKMESLNKLHTEDILSISGEQVIRAKLVPNNNATIEITGNLLCEDINGINFDDFLYANEHIMQDIQSPVHFKSKVNSASLTMTAGTLNGLNVSEVLNPREIRIHSNIQVAGNVSADEVIVKNVNGINLGALRKRYWTKSTDQNVNVNITMPFEVVVEGNVTTQTFLGKALDRDFFLTNANEVLDIEINFENDVTLMQNAEVENLKEINGVSLKDLDEKVVKKGGSFNLTGNKVVDEVHIGRNLIVEETFNNLRIPEDIVLLSRPQRLQGINFASEVVATGDVFSQHGNITLDKIGSVELRDFIRSAALINEDATVKGLTDFQTHVDVENIVVRETINGVDIRKIFKEGIRLSSLHEVTFPRLTVNGNVVFNDTVDASFLNDYDIEDNFDGIVNISKPGTISGHKRVTVHTVNAKDASVNRFNKLPLDFTSTLMFSTNQTVKGNYAAKTITARSIEVRAINGEDLSGFVKIGKTDEVQLVQGSVEMERLTVEAPLRIENRVLNQCNVTEYLDVMAFKQFDSLRIANGTLMIEQPMDSNPLLGKLATKALRKDKAQEVDAAVTFTADVEVGNLDIPSNRAGDVDLYRLFNGTLLKSGDQEVLSSIKYTDKLTINTSGRAQNLEMVKWNGMDVQDIVDNVAVVGSPINFRAEKTFSGNLKVQNQLRVTGNINHLNSADLIKIADFDKLPDVKFTSLVIANMTVRSGIIDGVNLSEALQNRVPLVGNATVRSNLTFTGPVHSDFVTLKKINDLSINDLVLKTAAPGQSIKGQKTLSNNLFFSGNASVALLNGRNPEEAGAFVVLKDQPASFEHPLVFESGVSVLEQVCAETYDGENMTSLLSRAALNTSANENFDLSTNSARALLTKLQRTRNHLADFQFFEQVQQVPFYFPAGSNASIHLEHCSVPTRKQNSTTDTAAGVLIATHSSESSSCRTSKRCRCHRSVILPSDTSGRLNTLRTPARLKEYLENQTRHGHRIRLLSTADYLFVLVIETLPGCSSEKVKVAVLHPITFKLDVEQYLELNDTILDIVSETDTERTVYFAILKASSGVEIYRFNGQTFNRHQELACPKAVALALVKHSGRLFLAVASYGLEAVSYVWSMGEKGLFAEVKHITTIGATDVIFTKADGKLLLTFAQDPSSIAPYTENWSQLKVPAQVFLFSRTSHTFDLVQQLDIDRVVSLANLVIHGEPFIAAASFNGKVRIYRLISGQGFQAEQTFKIPGIKSIVGYTVKNETYLATMTESMTGVHIARLRGLFKPTVTV